MRGLGGGVAGGAGGVGAQVCSEGVFSTTNCDVCYMMTRGKCVITSLTIKKHLIKTSETEIIYYPPLVCYVMTLAKCVIT